MMYNRRKQTRSDYPILTPILLILTVAAGYFFWPTLIHFFSMIPDWGKGLFWGAVVLALLSTAVRLWRRLLDFLAWEKISPDEDSKEFFTSRLELIKTGAQILGGLFFLVGLWFTYQNLIVTQEKQVTDLFSKAVEQMGSDQIEVRLGGIYALERIAKNSAKDNLVIQEVLTAFVRERAPWPPRKKSQSSAALPENQPALTASGNAPGQAKPEVKPPTDIQAILTVLGRRQTILPSKEHDCVFLRGTDLRGAYLYGANLEGADLVGANLDGADLEGANFKKTLLEGTSFSPIAGQKTSLKGTDLRGAAGLTWNQVKETVIDKNTKLPATVLKDKQELEIKSGTP